MWVLFVLLIAGCSEAHAVAPKKNEPKLPLAEQLAREAATRPAQAVRPEHLIDALAQQGITITRHRQVLASPIEAAYCELLATDRGAAFSLCEFRDREAALHGRDVSKQAFDRLIPGRTLDARFNSLLTMTQPANEAQVVREVFARSEPR